LPVLLPGCIRNGFTALQFAAAAGNARLALFLLACGANANAPARHGQTPLHTAAAANRANVAKVGCQGARLDAMMKRKQATERIRPHYGRVKRSGVELFCQTLCG